MSPKSLTSNSRRRSPEHLRQWLSTTGGGPLSECLHKELAVTQSKLRTSVLCPEMIRTGIGEAERNRPKVLSTDEKSATRDMIVQATSDAAREGLVVDEEADLARLVGVDGGLREHAEVRGAVALLLGLARLVRGHAEDVEHGLN